MENRLGSDNVNVFGTADNLGWWQILYVSIQFVFHRILVCSLERKYEKNRIESAIL